MVGDLSERSRGLLTIATKQSGPVIETEPLGIAVEASI